ncbi:MAG: sigma-70 family RNA polymerase sigma factor [Myxococcota bacterium]
MITSDYGGSWRDLEARLRPFVARRVPAPADVDDVLQEVALRMQRGLAGLREDERFGPWVYQVARSAIADQRRAAARHPLAEPSESDDASAGPAAEPATAAVEPGVEPEDDDAVAHEFARYVAPFVAMLPSPYREALTLTELEGLTQKEAAELLGISLSGMKSRVQRGRAKLREALEACCEIALDARGRIVGYSPRVLSEVPSCCAGTRPCR